MQLVGTEVMRYAVSPEETGLNYPLQVIVYRPAGKQALMAKIIPLELAGVSALSDEAVTWEDASWQ